MVSMIAAESMLRTDDFDLAYLADSEEVKADNDKTFPTTNACGANSGKAPAAETAATCSDVTTRCCLATYPITGGTKTVCVKSADGDSGDLSTANTGVETNVGKWYANPTDISATAGSTVAYSCPAHNYPAVKDQTCFASGKTTAGSITDCDVSDPNNRCCYVNIPTGPNKGGQCLKSTKAKRTDALTFFTTGDAAATTNNVACGTDPAAATGSDCQGAAKADSAFKPAAKEDCTRDLTSKCCFATFGSTNLCLKAPNVARNTPMATGQNALKAIYGETLTAVVCQDSGTPLANQCGLKSDGKTKFTDADPVTDVKNCTSDKDDYCCKAVNVAKNVTKCVKTVLKKDPKANAGNATLTIEDTFSDLSSIECSSAFVKATFAVVAIVLALF